jgi:hypothetical protein
VRISISLRSRLKRELTFNAHYTWSRVMAVANGGSWLGTDIAVQDKSKWRADLGPASLHAADRAQYLNRAAVAGGGAPRPGNLG